MKVFSGEEVEQLKGPLLATVVAEREQGGRMLSYIEAWHAIAEANRIFGFDGWTRETVSMIETNRDLVQLRNYEQWRVGYVAKVRVNVRGVIREGTGFGSGMAKPEALGDAIESAVKEAESDAMKRALMTFGNPFGLALYDKTKANVVDPARQSRPLSVEPEGEVFWRWTGQQAMNANQAKKAGLDVVFKEFVNRIGELSDGVEIDEWIDTVEAEVQQFPRAWSIELRNKVEERAHELGLNGDGE